MSHVNEDHGCVFVIDDDASIRHSLSNLVRSAGMNVKTFASAQEFLANRGPDILGCLVLDVQLPGLSGLDLQEKLAKVDAHVPIIFITGHGDIPMTVRAMKAGAIEFLTKPFHHDDLMNAIKLGMDRARQVQRRCNRAVDGPSRTEPEGRRYMGFSDIVGDSAAMQHVLNTVTTVARTDSTVLIQGESGTGKELIARAVHELSARRDRSFIKLNCAAIPPGLLESDLFGHEKGAFTGAIMSKVGRFELADGGTLFLDEIGDIPLELQPKLLRVLQDQEFERLGSKRTLRVNVRIVAATNRPLAHMVTERQFREDLYYRLNVFPVQLPALGERREDIPLLVRHFMEKSAAKLNKRIESIPHDTMEALVNYEWPGNVRELENLIERSVILSPGTELCVHLSDVQRARREQKPTGSVPEVVERERILRALGEAKGVVGGPHGAAARLGLKRTSLQYKMHKYGIARPSYKLIS